MSVRAGSFFVAMTLAAAPALAAALQPSADLERAIRKAHTGEALTAIPLLEAYVREHIEDEDARDVARALLYLGVAHRRLGAAEIARSYFGQAWEANPDLDLRAEGLEKQTARLVRAAQPKGKSRRGPLLAETATGAASVATAVAAARAAAVPESPPTFSGDIFFLSTSPGMGTSVRLAASYSFTLEVYYPLNGLVRVNATLARGGEACLLLLREARMQAGRPNTVFLTRVDRIDGSCAPPFSVDSLRVDVTSATGPSVARQFPVSYTFLP